MDFVILLFFKVLQIQIDNVLYVVHLSWIWYKRFCLIIINAIFTNFFWQKDVKIFFKIGNMVQYVKGYDAQLEKLSYWV